MAKKKKTRKAGRKWKVYVPRTPKPPPLPISRKKAVEAVVARLLGAYHDSFFEGASVDDIMFFQGMARGLDPNFRDVMIQEYDYGPFDSTDRIEKTIKKINRVLNRRGSVETIVILWDWMKVRK